jgi:hypothetical protein
MLRAVDEHLYETERRETLAVPEFGVVEPPPDESRPDAEGAAAVTASFGPSCGGTTGPYRRVFSQPGYGWLAASIYLPGGDELRESPGTNDTVYVYAGGWGGPRGGGSGTPGSGDAVDAGFQHSPRYDDWALFVFAEGRIHAADPQRCRAGQEVLLQFTVPADDQVLVLATGYTLDGGEETRRLQVALRPQSGWRPGGAGIILKRMTSIAQQPQDFQTGSFLRSVRWRSSRIGTSEAAARPWTATETGGYCSYPRDRVTVQYVSAGEETDGIQL